MADSTTSGLDRWQERAAKELRGRAPEHLTWHTPEAIDVKPSYTEAGLEGLAHTGALPGFEPFSRGPEAPAKQGAEDIRVICGGVIPHQKDGFLTRSGVSAIYGPVSNVPHAAHEGLGMIARRRTAP